MLICIAGKNNIAVAILDYLIKNNRNRYELGIVCNKDENSIDSWQRSLRKFAKCNMIKEYVLEDLYNIQELIFLSMEFDSIIKPEKFLSKRLYNIHFSMLPKYKGMYTSAWPILNGEKNTGVTFHKIDSGIDTGDIIAQKEIRITEEDTCRDLYLKLIEYGINLVLNHIEDVINDKCVSRKQNAKLSTYYSKESIDYDNLHINLNDTAAGIDRQIRAFSFREYQIPTVKGHPIIETKITDIKSRKPAGSIIYKSNDSMMISTIDYNIVLYFDRFDELLTASTIGDLKTVKDICTSRKHVNGVNDKGWTPLIVATYNNQIEIVKYLLSVGADITVRNNNGTNILMYAKDAYVNTGDNTLLKLFLELDLDIYQKDYNDKCLIDYIDFSKIGLF